MARYVKGLNYEKIRKGEEGIRKGMGRDKKGRDAKERKRIKGKRVLISFCFRQRNLQFQQRGRLGSSLSKHLTSGFS